MMVKVWAQFDENALSGNQAQVLHVETKMGEYGFGQANA